MGCSSRLAGLSLRLALQSCLPGLPTHSDIQTSCGSPKLPTSCTSCRSPPRSLPLPLPPKPSSRRPLWSSELGAARAGRGSLPPQDPTSRPPPASCPPAPRGLCSFFLRAALPAAAGSRRHCLEPPVRRRGQGGLRRQGPAAALEPFPQASPPPPPAPSWSDSH